MRETMRKTAAFRENEARRLGASLHDRERQRAEMGEIRGSPLLLQVRGPGNVRAYLNRPGTMASFEIAPPATDGEVQVHVTGGIVPPGRIFLIERVRILAQLGSADNRRGGILGIDLPGTPHLQWRNEQRRIEFELTGRQILRHGEESSVRLQVSRGAASMEIHGRLVSEAEGEAIATRPLITGEGEGFLTSGPVLMQVLAAHGGGNPNTLTLAGQPNMYLDALSIESLWNEARDLRSARDSRYYYRGCGRVPPGKAFRITRIHYRARLDPQGSSHSDLRIRAGGKTVIETDASKQKAIEDVWNGDLLLRPGDENKVSLTCSYYAMAEMTVYGELVDAPETGDGK